MKVQLSCSGGGDRLQGSARTVRGLELLKNASVNPQQGNHDLRPRMNTAIGPGGRSERAHLKPTSPPFPPSPFFLTQQRILSPGVLISKSIYCYIWSLPKPGDHTMQGRHCLNKCLRVTSTSYANLSITRYKSQTRTMFSIKSGTSAESVNANLDFWSPV